jgi:threonine/homoserine/homoserine lactone efflux protein
VQLGPFFVLSILLLLIPGPDTAVVTKNALLGGRRGGLLTAAGVPTGLATWTAAAALGIAALLRASAFAFLWLAAYGWLVGHGASVLRKPSVRRVLDRVTGVVLIGFGIRLAFERR